MLPAPKIVKAESNHTDLHAKIAEPPPIFYKDSEKIPPANEASSFYVQKVLVGGVFRMRGAEGGCGSFRRCCFRKARYRTDWKIGPEKTRFLRSFALCFPLRLFPISVYFPCYSSARRSGRVRSLCLRAKFSRICLAFCLSLPNYELTPISESMCESPFRCRCAVAEDAGFARKRGDYMYKENPFDSEPEPKG